MTRARRYWLHKNDMGVERPVLSENWTPVRLDADYLARCREVEELAGIVQRLARQRTAEHALPRDPDYQRAQALLAQVKEEIKP